MPISDYPPVTVETLEEVVRRILSVGSPLRIVPFGSRATARARPWSDLDLLIVEESDLPRYKRPAKYLRVLVGVFPAKDVVVWTPQEIQAWSGVPTAFITTILSRGEDALCPMSSAMCGVGFLRPKATR